MEAEAAQAVADPWHSHAAQEEEDSEHDQKVAEVYILASQKNSSPPPL